MQERIQRRLWYESERKYYDLEAENCYPLTGYPKLCAVKAYCWFDFVQ